MPMLYKYFIQRNGMSPTHLAHRKGHTMDKIAIFDDYGIDEEWLDDIAEDARCEFEAALDGKVSGWSAMKVAELQDHVDANVVFDSVLPTWEGAHLEGISWDDRISILTAVMAAYDART